MNTYEQDQALSIEIARRVAEAGGRAMYVGGMVRDGLRGIPCKDIDIEVYGLTPERLSSVLTELLSEPDKLQAMAKASRAMGRPQAASDIADLVLDIAKK